MWTRFVDSALNTSEAQFTVAESCVVGRAFLLHFSSSSATFDTFIKLGPAVSTRIFLQAFFLCSSVLEPHLMEIIIIIILF